MNQLNKWKELDLDVWHKGTYPDMDCEEIGCFGHAEYKNHYLWDTYYGSLHEDHNADETVVHTLCNSLTEGSRTRLKRATHYEDFTEEYIRAETDEIRRR